MIKNISERLVAKRQFILLLLAIWGAGIAQVSRANEIFIHQPVELQNEQLISKFYDQFFNAHNVRIADEVIREDYIQHNPTLATGRAAFEALFSGLFVKFPQFHTQIVRLLAAGDLVWVHTHQTSTPSALGLEIIDIYRIENGKIAEHWDSLVPVSASPANSNSQF